MWYSLAPHLPVKVKKLKKDLREAFVAIVIHTSIESMRFTHSLHAHHTHPSMRAGKDSTKPQRW